MPVRPCLNPDCRTLIQPGRSYCHHHQPVTSKRWQGGSTRAWRQQRERVMQAAGYQCTAIINGKRCTERADEAHHLYAGTEKVVGDHEVAAVCRAHNPRGARAA